MRNIKFRAWDGKKIIINNIVTAFDDAFDKDDEVTLWLDGTLKGDEPHEWQKEGLMQFTGLKDVDSVEIYENDIVGFGNDSPSCSTGLYGELGTVFYCEDTCSFKVRLFSTLREVALDDHNLFSSGETCRKVYGNVYVNNELTGNNKL
jgi:hypothetical protein